MITIDGLVDAAAEVLDPRNIQRRFTSISQSLENIIRNAHDDLSRVEEKLVEVTGAFGGDTGISKTDFESLASEMLSSILQASDFHNGLFCHSTAPDWEHIQTAYVLQIFDYLQLPQGSWFVRDQRRSVEQMLLALVHSRRPNGSWGEDFYDTCYACNSLLLLSKTHAYVTGIDAAIRQAISSILDTIDNGFSDQFDQEWYGAGFYGAALALLGRHSAELCRADRQILTMSRIESLAQKLLEGATTFYEERSGLAHFKSDRRSTPTTPDEWHTAEMLVGLHYAQRVLRSEIPVSMCTQWLRHRLGQRHLWCDEMGSRISFIITGRVLHALALTDEAAWAFSINRVAPVLERYQGRMTPAFGLVYDLPVTINLLLGISAKSNVRKRTSHNQLQTAIIAGQLHALLDQVADVKRAADVNAKRARLAYLPYALFVVLVVGLLTLSHINEVRTFLFDAWEHTHKFLEGPR